MKRLIYRYSALLLAGTALISTTLPQVQTSANPLPLIQAQITAPDASTETLPTPVARQVKREIAKTFKIPVSQLKVVAAQARTWNGCYGLPAPNAACTMIAISGWQVIVTGQQRTWVYHTNQDGSQVRLNQTASLTNRSTPVQIGFIPADQAVPNEASVVFHSVEKGGISNRTTLTKLTAEGVVTRQTIAPNIRSTPIVIKRLTRDQVNTFLSQVQQQRFNHLNRLRYFSDRGADFEATQLSDGSTIVEYANPLRDELPSRLQTVIQTWQRLLQP
jgi:hypothetical protein